jgi:hypothetical protein
MNKGLLVRLVSSIVIIVCIISFYFAMKEAGKLRIASLDVEETYPSDAPFFRLRINNYGVDGNTIWVNGTVTWIGPVDEYITGNVQVSMYVYPKVGSVSKDVHVWIWRGITVLPKNMIEDRVEIPPLGGKATPYSQSFNFLLSVTV